MPSGSPPVRLKKELSLGKIYAIAIGATLGSGFFLLPGLAAAQAGPAVIVSYLLSALHLLPAVLSIAELSTAMPRSGGIYFFLDRSMGPLIGTIGGVGTWLALILKTAFALIGMGAYISLFFPGLQIVPLAIGFAIFFTLINLFGAEKSGGFQVLMVCMLAFFLAWFIGHGLLQVTPATFDGFWDAGFDGIYATTGLVFVSYVGLTKIVSISEEVQNPERNLPLAMLLALGTAVIVYSGGLYVMLNLLPAAELHSSLTPAADAARLLVGPVGAIAMTIAAMLAFFSVTNAAILSVSRYPLAMSRDHLLPSLFRGLSKRGTPLQSIILTSGTIILVLLLLDPARIAKLASAFQLVLFALCCLAVIIMRESRIDSYDPGFRSPLYPWMQLAGIIAPMLLVLEMGWMSILFTIGLITLSVSWYFWYARDRVKRGGAIYHSFARLGERRDDGLDRELRGILKEKGLRAEDPFDMIVARADIFDADAGDTFEDVVQQVAARFSQYLPYSATALETRFLEGTRVGATPVTRGVALPHLRLTNIERPELAIVRAPAGIRVEADQMMVTDNELEKPVFAFFFLVSPENNPGQHLRLLAQIASKVEEENFMEQWFAPKRVQRLKEIFFRDERILSLLCTHGTKTGELIGRRIREIDLPPDALIAMVYRKREIIIPKGKTVLKEGDQLTIIANATAIEELKSRYGYISMQRL